MPTVIVGIVTRLLLSARPEVGPETQQQDDGWEEDGDHGDQLRAVRILLQALVIVAVCDHGGSLTHRSLQIQSQLS
jgi:hypothetical protein